MALRLFSKFRKLLDVIWGTPDDRHAPIYDSGAGKLVMREILSADIGDATPENVADKIVRRNSTQGFFTTFVTGNRTEVTDASLTLGGGISESGSGAPVYVNGGAAEGEGTIEGGQVIISAGEGINQSAPMSNGQAVIYVNAATGGDDGNAPFTDGGSIVLTPGAGAGSGGNGNVTITRGNLNLSSGVVTATSFSGIGTSLTALNASNITSGTVPVARLAGGGTASSAAFLRGDSNWSSTLAGPLTISGPTVTTSTPVLNVSQVLSGAGTAFTVAKINCTGTWAANSTLLLDIQSGGVSRFTVQEGGRVDAAQSFNSSLIRSNQFSSPGTNTATGLMSGNFNVAGTSCALTTGSYGGASVAQVGLAITPTVNQTGTSSFTAVKIAVSETALGSGNQRLIDIYSGSTGTTNVFYLKNNGELFARAVNFTVATLPASSATTKGRVAFATDGRKTGEGAAAGTGTLCYDDGTAWRRVSDDSTVAA